MHPQNQQHYAHLLEAFKTLHADAVRMSRSIKELVKEQDLQELSDLNYVLRQCEEIANSLRKSYKNMRNRVEKSICLIYVSTTDVEDTSIKTDYCTVTPRLGVVTHVPNQGDAPREHAALLKALGVPDEVAQFGALAPRWAGMVEYCTWLAEQGRPLPEGGEKKVYNVYKTTVRKKRDILEGFEEDVDITPIMDDPFMPPQYRKCCALCGEASHTTEQHGAAVSASNESESQSLDDDSSTPF